MSPMSSTAAKAKVKTKAKAKARLRRGRRDDADDFEAINRAIANVMKINKSVEANKGLKNTNIPNFNGFDMTCIPEVYSSCSFSLVPEKDLTRLIRFSVLALEEYNVKNKTKYVYSDEVKALSAPFNGSVFYIMFGAMQPYHFDRLPPAYFQTLVCQGIPAPDGAKALKIEFINMVSSPNPTKEEEMEHVTEMNKSDEANDIVSCDDDEYFDEMYAYNYYHIHSNMVSYHGFDMTCIPEGYSLSFSIVPGDDHSIIPDLIRFSKLAIEEYNIKNKTKYEYAKYVKALAALVNGFVFYIMFEAKEPSCSSPAYFQTLVYDGIPARDGTETLEIEFINLVSTPSPTKEEGNSCGGN